MKTKLLLSIFLICAYPAIFAQQTEKYPHSVSFEKSMLSDTLDALSYTIHIDSLDFTNQKIYAHTQVVLTPKINNLSTIKLELMNLTVDSVFVEGSEITNFTHTGYILAIPLTSPVNIGDNVSVIVWYHGVPFHESWGGFHWAGQYAFNLGVGFVSIPHNLGKAWFPCIDDFQDRAYYTVYATVTNDKEAVCGGLLESVVNNGNGTHTYKWVISNTIPTYLASVAVGDYVEITDTYNGINGDVPIEIWVRPQDSIKVDGSFTHLKDFLSIYENSFGPYKWDRVGYVATAIGAMEHVMNIGYPYSLITGNTSNEAYIAHELSHMWFGDNVTCASAEDMWLNEGWAVFCDGLTQEVLYGEEQYKNFIMDKNKNVLQLCHTPSGDGSYFPLNQIPQAYTYNMSAYDRGATIVYTLRNYLGDSLFFSGMTAYNQVFEYNSASSYDLRDFLTSNTGIDMTGWFDNWVFHSGTPHYSIDSFNVVPAGNGADVTVYLRQKRHGPAFIGNSNIVEVTFMDNNWNRYSDTVHFDGATGSSVKTVPFVPDIVLVDLNEKMCDAMSDYSRSITQTGEINFTNSFFKLEVESVSDSAFFRIEHNWAPPDEIKTPVQGLTISPYRYWKVDGIFPDGFTASGKFWYNKNAFLDDSLIFTQNDSVVLLYRSGTASDWNLINTTQEGIWSIGNLVVSDLQRGEYALAVCDDTFTGIKNKKLRNGSGLNIYPNPSRNQFIIRTAEPGILTFSDLRGNIVDTVVASGSAIITWHPQDLQSGTYLVSLNTAEGLVLDTEKIVLIKD